MCGGGDIERCGDVAYVSLSSSLVDAFWMGGKLRLGSLGMNWIDSRRMG